MAERRATNGGAAGGPSGTKLTTAAEAVARFVPDGAQVALGGFTINRNPMALVYEVARRGVRGLHVVAHSNGQALDTLIGAGCVSLVEIAYGGNGRFAPTCVRFRRAVEHGDIAVEDYTNNQMALRFLAGSLGVPFIPTRSGLHTDIVAHWGVNADERAAADGRDGRPLLPNDKLLVAGDPFGDDGEQVVLLPALTPDVALVHAQVAGDDGTVLIEGLTFADLEQAKSARHVIVSAERVVPAAELREDGDRNSLPPFLVDAVVEAPWGAHPTGVFRRYDYDPGFLKAYGAAAKDDVAFAAWLDKWVYGVSDHEGYVARLGGEALQRLAAEPGLGYARGLDRR